MCQVRLQLPWVRDKGNGVKVSARELVNATVGFEELAIETSKSSKSLHRMLSTKANPTIDNLTVIFNVLRKALNVDIKVHTTVAGS